ncbi:MAG: hypothetical protein BMS9Abin36_1421 [Gammaproteobacteria bacterium]|nr:MAG: hypothetical protein BMS9Abin36_1421 [Gammaproteobacteria bacterium]
MRLAVSLFVGAILILVTGCEAVTVEDGPGGNTLCFNYFQSCINPILDENIAGKTCSASGCHRQGEAFGGAFRTDPTAADGSTEMLANFISAKGATNLNNAANSKLLTKPLVSGILHGGGVVFTTADPQYSEILYWINNSVTAQDDPICDNLFNGTACQIYNP